MMMLVALLLLHAPRYCHVARECELRAGGRGQSGGGGGCCCAVCVGVRKVFDDEMTDDA